MLPLRLGIWTRNPCPSLHGLLNWPHSLKKRFYYHALCLLRVEALLKSK